MHEVPRPALMAGLTAPLAGGFFLLLNQGNACLYAGSVVIGTCTGAITSVAASATSELFGSEFFAINHNIVVSNSPIGSLLYGFFAEFTGVCMGAQCYERTFLVGACILHIRTRKARSMIKDRQVEAYILFLHSSPPLLRWSFDLRSRPWSHVHELPILIIIYHFGS
ncbi:unnamed protein product [Spirodela intermedia]|uniref:NFD4 C-terminal domain-containing protein n=1 Tax=Spirodela intermedia TaxID=51605 RepID=A0A7I8JE80_SPIIN|nr:unnamed protein product [Spirodela intermedia]CAA6668409.1 unnamed protein product [Spirodela intermedia]